jgi:hypothetical protein
VRWRGHAASPEPVAALPLFRGLRAPDCQHVRPLRHLWQLAGRGGALAALPRCALQSRRVGATCARPGRRHTCPALPLGGPRAWAGASAAGAGRRRVLAALAARASRGHARRAHHQPQKRPGPRWARYRRRGDTLQGARRCCRCGGGCSARARTAGNRASQRAAGCRLPNGTSGSAAAAPVGRRRRRRWWRLRAFVAAGLQRRQHCGRPLPHIRRASRPAAADAARADPPPAYPFACQLPAAYLPTRLPATQTLPLPRRDPPPLWDGPFAVRIRLPLF